jgi:hypothetical protein
MLHNCRFVRNIMESFLELLQGIDLIAQINSRLIVFQPVQVEGIGDSHPFSKIFKLNCGKHSIGY